MNECIFCKIINKEIPSEIVYEDELILAFNDIEAKAPTHILVIPKKHIPSLNDLKEEDSKIISHIFSIIPKVAEKNGINKSGYRVVNNCGKDGGQTVDHIHFHVLGGRNLTWPPG
ncbi:histidine triad nucleotide-binding protein [Clostridium sp. D2Q-11]|uniref:Histidine triad nucleotide-binding protein n=1 Tax=Anaeromonas frigoriresistens TaxID=2683708 RepID=A0A942UUX2_9FIRM|nr:histidine triad nucleotide-binding protein [Anaeromonas frigoriresistens]MBS4536881.1 histidine triad nucleotide-binding protein [Anaeromonas frigoriresistens]